jgi:hypothetical protein
VRTPEQRTPERIAYLLDRFKEFASVTDDDPSPAADGGDAIDIEALPYDWLVTVDTFETFVENREEMERRLRTIGTLPNTEDRLAKGVDDYWRGYIEVAVDDRMREIAEAHQLLQRVDRGDRFDEIDQVIAEEIVLSYEEEDRPARESLIRDALDEAARLRTSVLAGGVMSAEACCRALDIGEEELYALMRGGQLIAVADHQELLFPRFQFHSTEALHAVMRIGKWQDATYPSWLWASRWFIPLDAHRGRSAAELIEAGKAQDLTAGLWDKRNSETLRTVA